MDEPTDERSVSAEDTGRHRFNRIDWTAFFAASAIALVVYIFSLAPTITPDVSGEYSVAADHLGVLYGPGYSVWIPTAWLFQFIFDAVTYHGHPNPAWAIGLMSACFSAATAGLVALLVSHGARRSRPELENRKWSVFCVPAVSAAVTLALTHTLWSKAVVVSTFPMKAFFHVLMLVLACAWMNAPKERNRLLYIMVFLFGVGISSFPSLAWIILPVAVCVFLKDRGLFRDFTLVLLVIGGLFLLGEQLQALSRECMPGDPDTLRHEWAAGLTWRQGPASLAFWAYPALSLFALGLAAVFLPKGKPVSVSLLLCGAGILVCLLYIPIAAERGAPVNYGNARTWQGFMQMMGRGSYERVRMSDLFSVRYLKQIAGYSVELFRQFGLPATFLGVLGIVAQFRRNRRWAAVTVLSFLVLSLSVAWRVGPNAGIHESYCLRPWFIQSYCIFALWIGAGTACLLGMFARLKGKARIPMPFVALLVLQLPLVPVMNNAFNDRLVEERGGAEQNGHDFAWQYGYYALEGVRGVGEHVDPSDVPPSTNYPPPMDENAICFVGTDPGRSTFEYMAHSAKVRTDVFLLSQNMLASWTYSSSIRDLYGDRIWMPSAADGNTAFRRYAEAVQAGVRGNRLTVSGIGAVMDVNGILAEMIVENNKFSHAFYIEESYVIEWMYPYLEPHGLILKLHPEPLAGLSEERVNNDMEFWARYKTRLLADPKFRRDFAARKMFSKLRGAIGGLYEYRGMFEEAETAYEESVELCPVSSEANFRLAGFCMKTKQAQKARDTMLRYIELDPNNNSAHLMLAQIEDYMLMVERKTQIEEQLAEGGPTDFDTVMTLLGIYGRLRDREGVRRLVDGILSNENVPPRAYVAVAQLCAQIDMLDQSDAAIEKLFEKVPADQRPPECYYAIAHLYEQRGEERLPQAVEYMLEYLALKESDSSAWHELGVMYVGLEERDKAVEALEQAVKYGGDDARDSVKNDYRLAPLASHPDFRKLVGGR